MTGTTKSGLPYPTGTDKVVDGDNAMQALAKAVDPRLPLMIASGGVTFPSTAGSATSSVVVTFPSWFVFTAIPEVVITAGSTAPHQRPVSVSNRTLTGFTAYFTNTGTTAVGLTATWIAVQTPTA